VHGFGHIEFILLWQAAVIVSNQFHQRQVRLWLTYQVYVAAKNTTFIKKVKNWFRAVLENLQAAAVPILIVTQIFSRDKYQFDYTVGTNTNPTILNGTYFYANSNTTIIPEPLMFVIHWILYVYLPRGGI